MWQSVVMFFHSLPGWWTVLYGLTGMFDLVAILALFGERISLAAIKGFEDEEGQPLGAIGTGAAIVCTIVAILNAFGGAFKEEGQFVCLRMMLVGALAYGLPVGIHYAKRGLARFWKWGKATRAAQKAEHRQKEEARKLQQARDPKNILAECKVRFAQAKRERLHSISPTLTDAADVMGFDQAGDELMKFLERLFALVEHINAWFVCYANSDADRKRADDIFPEVPLDDFVHLLGTDTVDADTLGKLRTCAEGLIETTVVRFERLLAEVRKENCIRDVADIKGEHEQMSELLPLPTETSSTGSIADFETGRFHERLLERLTASVAQPVPAAPFQEEVAVAPVRAKVRA